MPPTPLVGRAREVAAVRARLLGAGGGGARLVTLTGPGGVGKTRLALAAAAALVDAFPGGVRFVDLAPVAEPAGVGPAIAPALDADAAATGTVAPAARTLLVLDNFEHVLGAAPLVAGLLATDPALSVLVTSRAPLRLAGEHLLPVPPLPLPPPDALRGAGPVTPAALAQVAASEAVALFVQRTRAGRPGFALTPATAGPVARLCARLDGLPLALELAAARVCHLTPDDILARLGGAGHDPAGGYHPRRATGLGALAPGPLDAPGRHRTLSDAVAWSHSLLAPPEQALFRRLAVFAGTFSLTDAEAVAAADDGAEDADTGHPPTVLEGLAALVDASLLGRALGAAGAPDAGETRFRFLETIRAAAMARLAAGTEAEAVRGRHAAHFLALAEMGRAGLLGPDLAGWLDRLEAAHADLRAALRWHLARGDGTGALRLAVGLGRFWHVRGHFAEGRAWLAEALAAHAAGSDAAEDTHGERDAGLPARALFEAGRLAYDQGEWGEAAARYGEALDRRRRHGMASEVAWALTALADATYQLGDTGRARGRFAEAVAGFRAAGDGHGAGVALMYLGTVVRHLEGPAAARPLYAESEALLRPTPDAPGLAQALDYLGRVARSEGDLTAAFAHQREALELRRALGHRKALAISLRDLGTLAGLTGDHARAARLLAAAGALRRAIGSRPGAPPPDDQDAYDGALAAARAHLGGAAFAAAWAAGEALSVDEAVEEALAASPPAAPPAGTPTNGRVDGHANGHPHAMLPLLPPPASTLPPGTRLTARELEVAALVGEGLSNREVAARLVVTVRTAENHVQRLLDKLGLGTRTRLALWARAHLPLPAEEAGRPVPGGPS